MKNTDIVTPIFTIKHTHTHKLKVKDFPGFIGDLKLQGKPSPKSGGTSSSKQIHPNLYS